MEALITSPADLGRLVRHVRHQHGFTQRELAARIGVTHRWLSELESGRGKQANDRYFEVLGSLGITLTASVPDA